MQETHTAIALVISPELGNWAFRVARTIKRWWVRYLDSARSDSAAYRYKRGGHWTLSPGQAGVDPRTWERDGRGEDGNLDWYEESK